MEKFCILTNKKKYFSNTPWGQQELGNKEKTLENFKDIFDNREKFIVDFKIVKNCQKSVKYIAKYIDYLEKQLDANLSNVEVYEQENGDIVFLNNDALDTFTTVPNLHDINTVSSILIVSKADIRKATAKTNKEYLETFYKKNGNKTLICDICGEPYKYSCLNYHKKTKIHQKMAALKESGALKQ